MNAISIIMTTYNRGPELIRTLEAYECQQFSDQFEMIVVDDCSSDNTFEILSNYQARRFKLRTLRLERNGGPGQARNQAIPLAEAPLILITGDDMLPQPSFLEAHLTMHRRHPQTGAAVLGKIVWPNDIIINNLVTHIDGVGAQQFSYRYFQTDQTYDFRHFYTSNISLKRELLYSVNRWFDPDFKFAAFEDAELGYRLAQNGLKIWYTPYAVASHYHHHNVYTFSTRQYKAGLTAHILVRKHPEVAPLIYGRRFFPLMALLFLRYRPFSEAQITALEQLAMRIGSYLEWLQHPYLDSYYIGFLRYFYHRGVMDSIFYDERIKNVLHGAHAHRALYPLVKSFFKITQAARPPIWTDLLQGEQLVLT